MLQTLYVFIVHRPHAPLSETFIHLRRGLRPHQCAIGSKAFEVLAQQFLHTLSATNERHQHEDTPEHAEAREERATLVASQRVENLSICIYI